MWLANLITEVFVEIGMFPIYRISLYWKLVLFRVALFILYLSFWVSHTNLGIILCPIKFDKRLFCYLICKCTEKTMIFHQSFPDLGWHSKTPSELELSATILQSFCRKISIQSLEQFSVFSKWKQNIRFCYFNVKKRVWKCDYYWKLFLINLFG